MPFRVIASMRAITLCACAALALFQAGCFWRRQAEADANGAQPAASPNASPAASPAPSPPPLPPGSDARAYFDRGLEDYRANRDAAAVEAFREAVRLDPDFAEAHYRLGLALAATGQDEESDLALGEAVKVYEKLVKEDAKNSDAQFFLGLSYSKLGEYQKAIKAFKESIRHAPEEDDDRFYELGLAQYKLAEYAESVRSLEKALAVNPDNFPALDLLERARSGRERREAFLKRQEQQRKQQGQNANQNANANTGGGTNRNAPPAPTPGDQRPRRVEPPNR
jgi:tetratricopeptide (TPR) repeat protein